MIHEVDEALRGLFRAEALAGSQVTVVFDAPTREWAAKVSAPTINLYLYDIREDMRRRQRGLHNEYNEEGVVVARVRPPRFFKLSYLITAWTRRPEDEHRLLSALLVCLMGHDVLPEERLGGELAALGVPVPMTIALPPPTDRSFADVWNALGGELKPSLDLVVSVPVTASPRYPAGPPVGDEGLRVGFSGLPGAEAESRAPAGNGGLPLYGTLPDGPSPERRRAEEAAAREERGGTGGGRRSGIASRVSEEES
ncbi:hypothetical protein GCM10009716_15850 [Streptomyces sodiiphilus]|uniref:Pvc16 N-terminal domain-containing protein n=1 Tax=Streptomyces sodiiphilus TaxID=226217 RepID=A0ABN2NYV5_9ACTN